MRVRREHLKEAQHSPYGNKGNPSEATRFICYTVLGLQDYFDENDNPVVGSSIDLDARENNNTFAMKAKVDSRTLFYVRRSRDGRFYDPFSIDGGSHTKQTAHTQERVFEFHRVNKEAFKFYLDFLKTKNKAYLRNAERKTF